MNSMSSAAIRQFCYFSLFNKSTMYVQINFTQIKQYLHSLKSMFNHNNGILAKFNARTTINVPYNNI